MNLQDFIDKGVKMRHEQIARRLAIPGPVRLSLDFSTYHRLYREPSGRAMSVAVLAFIGVGFAFWSGSLIAARESIGEALVVGVLALLIVGGAVAVATARHTLVLDPDARSWMHAKGNWPKIVTRSGTYDEIVGVRFASETVIYRHRSRQIWRSRLVWKDGGPEPFVLAWLESEASFISESDALIDVRAFCDRVGLPLLSPSVESSPR